MYFHLYGVSEKYYDDSSWWFGHAYVCNIDSDTSSDVVVLIGCGHSDKDGDGEQWLDDWHVDGTADGRQDGSYGDLHSYGDGAREQVDSL